MKVILKPYDMKRKPVNSSAIKSIGYNEDEEIVEVEIRNTKRVYRYYHVPPEEYQKFITAASLGTYYNKDFKDKFGDDYDEIL